MNFFDKCSIELLTDSVQMVNMSDEEYFTSPLYTDYVSNSRLKLINPKEGGNPEMYFNPPKQGFNGSLEFGSAVHELILQPDDFALIDYQDKPSAKLGEFVDKVFFYRHEYHLQLYKAIELASKHTDYYADKLTPKIIRNAVSKSLRYYIDKLNNDIIPEMPEGMQPIVLSASTYRSVVDCINAYENNSAIKALLTQNNFLGTKESYNEMAMLSKFKVTLPDGKIIILPFKLKIDNYSVDNINHTVVLNDLKTTSHEVDTFMGSKGINPLTGKLDGYLGSWQKMHYYRQIAAYMFVLQSMYNQKGDYTYNANILAIESKPPYNSRVFKISNAYVEKGLKEFKELMCRVAFHKTYGINTKIED